ncbi:MAG: helix-turn-helix transcriptional regulator [bacterium]
MIKGDRLKAKRLELGLTQEELGSLIGVGKSIICLYEKETRNPSVENIIELVNIFGVSSDYLLGTDKILKTVSEDKIKYRTLTVEEELFLDEIKKDKVLYNILLQDPKKGSELIKKRIK